MIPAARKGKAACEKPCFIQPSVSGACRSAPRRFFLARLFCFCALLTCDLRWSGCAELQAQESSVTTTATATDSLPYFPADSSQSSSSASPQFLAQTWFGHDIQLYLWQSQLRWQQGLAANWQLQVFGNLNSILQPQGTGDLWKDDHSAGIQFGRPLPGNGRLELAVETKIFRDALTGGSSSDFSNNDFSSSRVRFNQEWQATPGLRVAPRLG